MGCCQQQRPSNEPEVNSITKDPRNISNHSENVLSPHLKLSLDDQPTNSNENHSGNPKNPLKANKKSYFQSNFNLPLPVPGKKTRIIDTLEETARNSHRKTSSVMKSATQETLGTLKSLEIQSKVGNSYNLSKAALKKGVNSVGGAISTGLEQSSALLAAQVAIFKEGLDEALNLVKDLNIKRRITDIVSPILRKFFIHSVTCELSCKYQVNEIIGKGSFSVVRKATDLQTRVERAAKIIIKNNLDENQTKTILAEIETLKALDHPNIIRVTEVVEEVNKLCIVTELCTGGELFDKIVDLKYFDETSAARIMYQLLSGLIHIHKKGFIHMDLKPENIMYADKSSDTIKIIDLGIAQSSTQPKLSLFGSAYYMAPEFSSGIITEKYDIWSCGVILFILLSGSAPFTGSTEQEILTKSRKGVIRFSSKSWKQVSPDAKDLIVKMLTKDISRRISAKEAWGHPWIQNLVLGLNKSVALNSQMMKNLQKFQKTSRLQKATLAYITSTMMSSKEINELKDAFVVLDTDGDGHLTELELRRGFEGLSISPAGKVEDIIKACDIDLNGLVDYTEFLTATIDWQRSLSHELLENVFAVYDQDSSGTISVTEVKNFLGQTGDEEFFKRLVSEGDLNGDGEIDLHEFKTLMLSVI